MQFIRNWLNREFAIIKNDHGHTLGTVRLKHSNPTFDFTNEGKTRTYNIMRDKAGEISTRGLFVLKRFYFYNLENPNPLTFNKTTRVWEPIIDSNVYHAMIQNDVIEKLNTVKKDMFSNLTPKQIVIGLIIIVALWYFIKKGGV